MFDKEEFPLIFNNTILHMISKGGNRRKEFLFKNRFFTFFNEG